MKWRSVKKNKGNPPPKDPEGEQAAKEAKGPGDLSEKEKTEQKN
jgi:hypothetical protein